MLDDKPPQRGIRILNNLIVVFLLAFLGHMVIDVTNGMKVAEKGNQTPITANEMYIYASSNPVIETKTELINCLIRYESSGNENAIGDNGKAHGLLQYHVPTFQAYCIDKYELAEDVDQIYNPEIQRLCCSMMLDDGGINHWTTKKYCYK